jgi:hypothetical protein
MQNNCKMSLWVTCWEIKRLIKREFEKEGGTRIGFTLYPKVAIVPF